MSTRPSGWYDDPDDDTQLRYYDGVVWTEHTAAKRPAPPQDRIAGHPVAPGRVAPLPAYPGAGSASGASWAPSAPGRRTAADGTPLAGWWRRVAAFLLDGIITTLITVPLAFGPLSRAAPGFTSWTERVQQAATSGAAVPTPPADLMADFMTIALTHLVVYFAYEVVFLVRLGATPGRMVLGILVRPLGGRGPVPFAAALRRTIIKRVSDLLGSLPLLGALAFGFQLLDYLWPIRDPGSQAIHDKAARTEVVRGRTPRRGSRGHRGTERR